MCLEDVQVIFSDKVESALAEKNLGSTFGRLGLWMLFGGTFTKTVSDLVRSASIELTGHVYGSQRGNPSRAMIRLGIQGFS